MFEFEATDTSLWEDHPLFPFHPELFSLPQARGSGHSAHFVFQDVRTPETAGRTAWHSQGTTPYTTHREGKQSSFCIQLMKTVHKGAVLP